MGFENQSEDQSINEVISLIKEKTGLTPEAKIAEQRQETVQILEKIKNVEVDFTAEEMDQIIQVGRSLENKTGEMTAQEYNISRIALEINFGRCGDTELSLKEIKEKIENENKE